ncbi:unnamed protein product [Bursaphelenchus xylophilus]|uniref:(pine wood nematode) hypothetical protein n=1 Tax=Bursaphelenchus xylophilus TaxID=6326 RepID=A0A1I7RW55_BURXY|nr:unnamed protein product [Bursaphelenchus xylophilus]CAG9095149.1 unnamed protein product [Bursaphelenchus xylophilus]
MKEGDFKVLYFHSTPLVNDDCSRFPTFKASKECMFPGLCVEIISLLADKLNLNLVPVVVNHRNTYEYIQNGTVYGILNYILNGTVDTIASAYLMNDYFDEKFNVSEKLFYTEKKLIGLHQKDGFSQYFGFFGSYQTTVWIAIGLSLALQCIFSVIVHRVEKELYEDKKSKWSEVIWRIVRLQLLQPQNCQSKLLSGKCSIIIFSLAQCAILMGILSSYILARLMSPEHFIPLKSLGEVLRAMDREQVYFVETLHYPLLRQTLIDVGWQQGLNMTEVLARNPIRYAKNDEEAMTMLNNNEAVMMRFDTDDFYFNGLKNCDFMTSFDAIEVLKRGFLFRKDYELLPRINKIIEQEELTITRLYSKYMQDYKTKKTCRRKGRSEIGIYPYLGLGIFLLVVNTSATFVLIFELITHNRGGCRQRKLKQ